jgi:hypothetical protein
MAALLTEASTSAAIPLRAHLPLPGGVGRVPHSAAALRGRVKPLDKATGQEVWKATRPSDDRFENEHFYASPVIWRKGNNAYLITHGNDYAIAHRLQDGSEIWRVGDLNPKDRYRGDLRFAQDVLPDGAVAGAQREHVAGGVADQVGHAERLTIPEQHVFDQLPQRVEVDHGPGA